MTMLLTIFLAGLCFLWGYLRAECAHGNALDALIERSKEREAEYQRMLVDYHYFPRPTPLPASCRGAESEHD
jgi:hypothetical protein